MTGDEIYIGPVVLTYQMKHKKLERYKKLWANRTLSTKSTQNIYLVFNFTGLSIMFLGFLFMNKGKLIQIRFFHSKILLFFTRKV